MKRTIRVECYNPKSASDMFYTLRYWYHMDECGAYLTWERNGDSFDIKNYHCDINRLHIYGKVTVIYEQI
jgi:hypothetical protein